MNYRKYRIILLLLSVVFIYSCSKKEELSESQKLQNFFTKKKVNIIITDSGLGGVSVAADVYERIKNAGVFEQVNITFFNAQPHIKSGYNSMETTDQKVQVLDNALYAMYENFDADLILIACNTLSVIYPLTPFAQNTKIPVIGIVETGVDQIEQSLHEEPEARVMIFATETTIGQNTHKKLLLEKGIAESRIITQPCPDLAGSIERGTHSEKTMGLVDKYVSEALNTTPADEKPIYASFNCTHYGYIKDVFAEKFKDMGRPADKFLDPNPKMADFMFKDKYVNRYQHTDTEIKVVSQPQLSKKRIEPVAGLIQEMSPQTAMAMRDFTYTPDLFEWESIAPLKESKEE